MHNIRSIIEEEIQGRLRDRRIPSKGKGKFSKYDMSRDNDALCREIKVAISLMREWVP
jgi:hypothetical protein